MEKKLWLIRHGESEANAGIATTTPESVGITAKGKKQAIEVANKFHRAPSLIITSCYRRAKETAKPTLQRFSRVRCEEWNVEEFTYLDSVLGIRSTVQERRPDVDKFWNRCDPWYQDGENAESFAQFIERVQRVIKRLQQRPEDFIVIFSHEQFIQALSLLLPDYNRSSVQSPSPFHRSFKASETNMKYFRWLLKNFRVENGSIVEKELHSPVKPVCCERQPELIQL